LTRTGELFGFLRDYQRELFSDDFQAELESMYRETGAEREPVPPALLAMATLLQAYEGMSDAEAVEMTVVDLLATCTWREGAFTAHDALNAAAAAGRRWVRR
jgi:hypothetical protein